MCDYNRLYVISNACFDFILFNTHPRSNKKIFDIISVFMTFILVIFII